MLSDFTLVSLVMIFVLAGVVMWYMVAAYYKHTKEDKNKKDKN